MSKKSYNTRNLHIRVPRSQSDEIDIFKDTLDSLDPRGPLDIVTCLVRLIDIEEKRLLIERKEQVIRCHQVQIIDTIMQELRKSPAWKTLSGGA